MITKIKKWLKLDSDPSPRGQSRRTFLKLATGAAVVAASPIYLVHRPTWDRVVAWRNGVLTPEQSERFIALVLDRSKLVGSARVVPFRPMERGELDSLLTKERGMKNLRLRG